MSTQTRLFQLLEYKDFYDVEKTIEDAVRLIQNIPSINLIQGIADFNIKIYLHDNDDLTGKVQFTCVSSLLDNCSDETKSKWASTVKRVSEVGISPILIWNYSNLKFYDLIFSNYNNLAPRKLSGVDTKNIFDAYLIINQLVNSQTIVENDYDLKNKSKEEIQDFIVSKLMFQRDYMSSLDFRNQVERGEFLFDYLSNHNDYSDSIKQHLENKGVSTKDDMYRVLLTLFGLCTGSNIKKALINLSEFKSHNFINLEYLDSLCINTHLDNYEKDISFLIIRNHFLYQIDDDNFVVLNVGFLLDHFFNSQVFSFHQYLKDSTGKSDFLSRKAKDIMEEIYLPNVLHKCFPNYIKFFGDDLLSSDHKELCDAYIRRDKDVILIEFKDILLNASVKNSTDTESIKTALNIKFESNQKGKPKGVTQLTNAINTIDKGQIEFDTKFITENKVDIFPIILYTDNSFGQEGLNSIYRKKLKDKIGNENFDNVIVRDLVFINLSFFEMRAHYLNSGNLDFYNLLESYLKYIKRSENQLTSFEVYARHYTNEKAIIDLPEPDVLSKYIMS